MNDATPSLRDLFEAALAAPDGTAWLEAHCVDPVERATLVRMLAADAAQQSQPLDAPYEVLLDRVGEVGSDSPLFAPGTAVGPYVLGERLGEGGNSIVFRANREQAGVSQQVALKLLRRGIHTVDEQRRFRSERRALALLRHPGIARLIEGGVTSSGVPYIALELVEGEPITTHVRERKLGLRERLHLFVSVCRAVEAAHRALIVHRDLKPSNVLVTHDGEVKLLDFGIAKLLDADEDTEATHTQSLAMTPAYAAPEQFRRGLVTAATDVYALGVLLGELLTGRRRAPGDTRTLSLQASAATTDAPLPSPALRRALHGDLDNIVLRAIDAEPERRYASAGALADDLQRYLDGLPVLAHPPARLYRARKFVTRHRVGVAAACAVMLAIVAALGVTLWQAGVAREQARRAATIKDFLIDMFRASDPRLAQDQPRGQVTAKELLDLTAPRIVSEFADDVDTRIELLGVAAAIYRELGEEQRYRSLHAVQVDLALRFHGEAHPAIIDGLLDDAARASDANDYAGAQHLLDQASPLIRRAGLDRAVQRARWWQVRAGLLASSDAEHDVSDDALAHAVDLYAEVAPRDPGYVRALNALAFHYSSGDPAQSERLYLRAIEAAQTSDQRDDGELQHLTYPGLAQAREDQGDYAGAEQAYARGAELAEKTYGATHSTSWVPAAQHAWTVHRQGERARALDLFDALLRAIPARWDADSYDEYAREFYASCLAAEGRAAEAIPLLEAAQRVYIAKPGVDYELRRNRLILGDAYDRVGRSDEARTMLKASLDERIAKESADARSLLDARERWGRFLLEHGDIEGAEREFREVLAQQRGRHLVSGAMADGGLARVALTRGGIDAAAASSERAVDAFEHLVGRRDVRSGPYLWLLRSGVLLREGDRAGARSWAQRALGASQRYDAPDAPSILQARAALIAAQ
jgi:tetratricopeptide (TPR) repeat protein